MSQQATEYERLRLFLGDLSREARESLVVALGRPDAADLLPRRELVLQALEDARRDNGELPQRAIDALLAPLDPFLVDYVAPVQTPGLIARAHRRAMAALIAEVVAPELVRQVDSALHTSDPDGARAFVTASQDVLAQRLEEHLADRSAERHDSLCARLGGDGAVADLEDALTLLQRRAMLGPLERDLRSLLKPGGEEGLKSARARLSVILDRTPDLLPFSLTLVRKRLSGPGEFARLAVLCAGSADGPAVEASPYAAILDLLVAEAEGCLATTPEADVRALTGTCGRVAAVHAALESHIRLAEPGIHAPRLEAVRTELSARLHTALMNLQPRLRGLLHVPAGERPKLVKSGDVSRMEAELKLLAALNEGAAVLHLEQEAAAWTRETRESLVLMAREILARGRDTEGNEAKAWKSRADALARLARPVMDTGLEKLVNETQAAFAPAKVRVAGRG